MLMSQLIDIAVRAPANAILTPDWYPLRYHECQRRAWLSTARFGALACGRGSGKTELARRKIILALGQPKSRDEDERMFFYALPTQAQAKRVAWDKLKSLVPSSWLARKNGISESDRMIRTEFGSQLHLVGMDKPQRIEGNQWNGGALDEACDQKPGTFARSIRPALSHKRGWLWMVGVPKRFGCGAAEFKGYYEQWASESSGPDYDAWTWSSDTVLTEAEIKDAKSNLDARDYAEQYGAIWQGASGLVFWAFDEKLNVRETKYQPGKRIYVGSDFNVDPMAWVFMHRYNDAFHVFDELWMRNTNTVAALNEVYRRYGNHQGGWTFIGDATARARNTRASLSDYRTIEADKRFHLSQVRYPRVNPPVVDRFASCNAHLCNAAGDRRLIIDPRCKHLIHDLGTRAYEEGTRRPDDHGDVGHITDALGYPIHYIAPVTPVYDDGTAEVHIG